MTTKVSSSMVDTGLAVANLGYTPINKDGDTMQGPLNSAPPVSLASASSVAIGAADSDNVTITGTTTITAFDTIAAGATRRVKFAGALTLTHNGTSLILPGSVNIATAANDNAEFISLGSGNWLCINYERATPRTLTSGIAVNSTAGTSIDFTGIPSWAKRITVSLNGVSKNSTASLLFQLGTSSGVETTSYASSGTNFVGNVTSTAGFIIADGAAAYTTYGHLVLTNLSNNLWIGSFIGSTSSTLFFLSAGTKTLSGTLDRIRMTTSSGTDTFDAGSVNIMYE